MEKLFDLGLDHFAVEIINCSNDFFGVADLNRKALFVNPAGRKIFGLRNRPVDDLTMFDSLLHLTNNYFWKKLFKSLHFLKKLTVQLESNLLIP